MSIVQLAAARCQPTSPNSIIAWSPEEEIKASTALRRELGLARSAQCRTLFVEREKRLSAERLARLALEEALARHKTCTGERDAARARAADAATLAARRRLSAGSAHRDADVESGDKRAAFQADRLRARRRRDDARDRSRAAAGLQHELNLERDAPKVRAEQRRESWTDTADAGRARAVRRAAKAAARGPADAASPTYERDFTRDETYDAGGPCVQTRGEGIMEASAFRTTVPATRHAQLGDAHALTAAATAATDAAARIRRTASNPAGLAAAEAAEKAALRRRLQAKEAQRALQASQRRGVKATRKDKSRALADRTQLELDRHRLRSRAAAKQRAPGVVLQSLRDERNRERAQKRGDFGDETQAAEDVVEAAAEAAYRAAAPTGFADIVQRGAAPAPRIVQPRPVALSAPAETPPSTKLEETRWSDRREQMPAPVSAPDPVVLRPRPPPPTPQPAKEADLEAEDEDVLDEAFLKELAEEGDRLDAEAATSPAPPAPLAVAAPSLAEAPVAVPPSAESPPPQPEEDDTLSSRTRRFHTTHHDGDLVFKAPAAPAFETLSAPVSLEDAPPSPEDTPAVSPFAAAIARRRAAVDAAPVADAYDDAFAAHVLPEDQIDFEEPVTPVPAEPRVDGPATPTPAFAAATPAQETFMDSLPRRDLDAALDEAPGQGTWYDETYADLSPLQDDREEINAEADRAVEAAEAELRRRDEVLEAYVVAQAQAALEVGALEAKDTFSDSTPADESAPGESSDEPYASTPPDESEESSDEPYHLSSASSAEFGRTTDLPRDDALLGLPAGLRSGDADALASWARRTLAETGEESEDEASVGSPTATSESALDAAERLLRSLSPDRPRVPSDLSPDESPTDRLATSSSSEEDGLDDVLRRLEELTAAMRERSARYEVQDASDNALQDLLHEE